MAHPTCRQHLTVVRSPQDHQPVPVVDGECQRIANQNAGGLRMTRSPTLAVEPVAVTGWRVIVTESRCEALVHQAAATYVSPVQTEQQARTLIALLASGVGVGGGPWRQPVAGGQRLIELEAQR
jgi:hypothetical protein